MNSIGELVEYLEQTLVRGRIELSEDKISYILMNHFGKDLEERIEIKRDPNMKIKDIYLEFGNEMMRCFPDTSLMLAHTDFSGPDSLIKTGLKFMLYREDGEGIMPAFTSTVKEDRNWLYLYLTKYSFENAIKDDIPEDLMKEFAEVSEFNERFEDREMIR